jgi:hypothetical protein
MNTSRGITIAVCSVLLALLVLVISGLGPRPNLISEAHADKERLPPATVAAFQQALQSSIHESAASTLEAIEAQASVLARIDANIVELAAAEEAAAAAEEAAAAAAEEAATKAAALPTVVRRSNMVWNVEGTWNYTTEQLAAHLQNSHGINVDGYAREELKIMHDNIHNGYAATGGNVAGGGEKGTRSVQTSTYQRPSSSNSRGVFGRVIAAPFESVYGKKSSRRSSRSNYCPSGGCPN